jgi:hypothetical protein
MAYPPQQGQYGYPQGPHGGPPKKDRAPLIAGLIFVVALLAGLGITGFVAPGFFLSDDKGGGGSSADSGDAGQGARPGGVGDGPADPTLRPGDAPADDSGDPGGSGSGDPESGPGGGSGGDGEALVEEFLTAVNAKDSAEANGMICADSPSNSLVDLAISKNPDLAVDTVEETKYFLDVTLTGTLDGEPLNLGKVSVKLTDSAGPCVFTFNAG